MKNVKKDSAKAESKKNDAAAGKITAELTKRIQLYNEMYEKVALRKLYQDKLDAILEIQKMLDSKAESFDDSPEVRVFLKKDHRDVLSFSHPETIGEFCDFMGAKLLSRINDIDKLIVA